MTTGTKIALQVKEALQDAAGLRWTDTQILVYLNDAIHQIVMLVPEANVIVYDVTATPLTPRQSLPANGVKFISVLYNSVAEQPPGNAIRYVERDVLDTLQPNWPFTPAAAGTSYFQHYCHDPRDPKAFELYPVAPTGTSYNVAVKYCAMPTDMSALTGTFPLGDEFVNAATDYIVYRALTREGRHSLPDSDRQALWDTFLRSLGMYVSAAKRISPDSNKPPEAA